MSLFLELITGSDLTLDRDSLTIVRKFRVRGTLPYTFGGDAFDFISSWVMGVIQADYPTYGTPMGTLFWNSIQLHESFYAQLYDVSVVYSPLNKQTGTYSIRIEHAAGTAQATAGVRQNGYPAGCQDNGGVFFDGQEVIGVDVPFNQTRIVVAYRHPQAFLNHTYLRSVGALVGHPNSDTFLGYAPGEVAYAGGNATESEAEASAEYSFDISRNETNLSVGGITVGVKKGFDVISPVYKAGTDQDAVGDTKGVKTIDCIEVIRPRGREWTPYVPVFGWGG